MGQAPGEDLQITQGIDGLGWTFETPADMGFLRVPGTNDHVFPLFLVSNRNTLPGAIEVSGARIANSSGSSPPASSKRATEIRSDVRTRYLPLSLRPEWRFPSGAGRPVRNTMC